MLLKILKDRENVEIAVSSDTISEKTVCNMYFRVGRQQRISTDRLSKLFQIVQATQELDSREENVVDTLYNGLLSSNRACLAQSITLTESTHPRKRLQAGSLLKKPLQHCKQFQEKTIPKVFKLVG